MSNQQREKPSLDEQGERDTEIRRDTEVRGSLGIPPSGNDTEKVTQESDLFHEQPGSDSKDDRQ